MARTGAVRRAGGAAVRGNKRSRSGGGSVRPPYGPGPSPDGEPTPGAMQNAHAVEPRGRSTETKLTKTTQQNHRTHHAKPTHPRKPTTVGVRRRAPGRGLGVAPPEDT